MKPESQGRDKEGEKEGKGKVKGRVKVKAEGYTHAYNDADTDAEADESGQTIVCLGCGSRWRLIHVCRASIIANLIECPLCELEPLEPKPDRIGRAEPGSGVR